MQKKYRDNQEMLVNQCVGVIQCITEDAMQMKKMQ